MKNSRRKGARGEVELARFLTHEGFPATRGQQHHGGPDAPDIRCESLSAIHWECKRVEHFRLYECLQQAIDESGERIPVVAHRRNGQEWVVVLRLSDLLEILRESDFVG